MWLSQSKTAIYLHGVCIWWRCCGLLADLLVWSGGRQSHLCCLTHFAYNGPQFRASSILVTELYPNPSTRTKAMGVLSQAKTLASLSGTMTTGWGDSPKWVLTNSSLLSYLFSISSHHPAGSLERQVAPLFILLIALCNFILALQQQQITKQVEDRNETQNEEVEGRPSQARLEE